MVHSLSILPQYYEKLNLKSITSRDITIKAFSNEVLQKKLDCIRVFS